VLLHRLLAHPATRGLDIDDPRTTVLRRGIIHDKPFLTAIYCDWYRMIVEALPAAPGTVLELGSGAGFLAEILPEVITSDVFASPYVRMILDAQSLPFAEASLRAIVMTNVLHHLPEPKRFLVEAARCVRPGGIVAMVEPWVSSWSRRVYTRLHHEPFDSDAPASLMTAGGPLSAANGALPWVLFVRERDDFDRAFACWNIESIQPMMPFRYLLSGGVSLRNLMPAWTTSFWRRVEDAFQPRADRWAMFAFVVLRRVPVSAAHAN
jgi:SAM-dependent methyltransferase